MRLEALKPPPPAPIGHNGGPPLDREEKVELLHLHAERDRRVARRAFYYLFPDENIVWPGPKSPIFRVRGEIIHARRFYARHMEFVRAGAQYGERCAMMANRVGKTVLGCFEDTCHATGIYPKWWDGWRFDRPTDGWACGKTNETTRDILQAKLFGPVAWIDGRKFVAGTGVVPGDRILDVSWKQGVPNLIDTALIRHESGGVSTIGLKSYEQGRGSFEGTEKDWVHQDEEPPADVNGECLIRTATTNGRLYLTFTPLEGMSEVVIGYLPADMRPATMVEEKRDYRVFPHHLQAEGEDNGRVED